MTSKDLVLYEKSGIRIDILPLGGCEVNACDRPDTHVIFWITKDWSQLHTRLVCARDAFVLAGIPGGVIFPQKFAPPLEWVLAQVNAEIARRRPPVQQQYFQVNFTQGSNFIFNVGNGTGGF